MTPLGAVVFNSMMGIIYVIPPTSDINNLLGYFSFATWTIYTLTFLSVIIFRFRKDYKNVDRTFKVPIFLPVICAGWSLYLVVGPLIENPTLENLLAFIIIISGVLVYIPFIWIGWKLPFNIFAKFEVLLQKYFEIVATEIKNK